MSLKTSTTSALAPKGVILKGRVKKKVGIFPLGGAFIFPHFQKSISKHALNHAKMQRNFVVPSDPPLQLGPTHYERMTERQTHNICISRAPFGAKKVVLWE